MVTRGVMVLACWLLVCVGHVVSAAEALLELPDPLIPNVQMTGELRVADAPSAITSLTFPSVPGLTIDVPDEGGSVQTTVINGKTTTTRGIPLLITARIQGPTKIPPITLHLQDGSQIATAAVEVRCAPGNTMLTGEAHADVQFSPTAIVPGEPTTLTYRIYLRRGSVETLGIEPPSGALLLGERQVAKGRSYDADGRQWAMFTISWSLTVATPGEYRVEGQQDYQVAVGDGFFDTRVLRGRVAVAPIVLTVKPLPVEGRPSDFTGLIGPLALRTELDRERIATGEGVELRIVAAGRQMELLKAPILLLPGGIQAYPKEDGKAPDRNTRIFRWDLVPSAPGDITLPPTSLPFFDSEAKVYRRAETQAVTLTVVPGRTRDLGAVGAAGGSTTAAAVALASTPAATPATMPPPLRGKAAQPPTPRMPLIVGALCLLGGAILALLRWQLTRPRVMHRGKALASAINSGDLDRAATVLALLRPSLTGDVQTAAASSLEHTIDRARFGGQPLAEVSAWIKELEHLP